MYSALSWLVELSMGQSVTLVIALSILVPVVTFSWSTSSFHRKWDSNASGRTPPTIPYLIPGLYHALVLISRPATYFTKWMKEFSNQRLFVVRAGRTSYVVVRDPGHVKIVLTSDRTTTAFEHAEVYDKVFGAPKANIESYKLLHNSDHADQLNHAHYRLPQKYLTGTSLSSLADIYISAFQRNMSNKMFQLDTWTQIEDLWSFFEIDITRACNEALFGSQLMKQYPKVTQDFWKLQANVEHFIPGLPRFTVSGIYEVRDRVLERLEKWLQATHGGEDFAKLGKNDPDWDESRGSKYFQERDQVLSTLSSFGYQSRAAEALGVMQSALALTMPSSFWCVVEALRAPNCARYLRSGIARYYNPQSGNYNIEALLKDPFVESLLAEVERLRIATRTIRTVRGGNLKLDNTWSIPDGISAITFSQDLGLNHAEWTKARPLTTARPLEQFWWERFLVPEHQPPRRGAKEKTSRCSLEGLESLLTAFGIEPDSKPVRSWAKTIQASTLAILMTEFEMQLCEPDYVEQVLPTVGEVAYGTVKPLDKIAIRIRRRRLGERSN